MTKCSFIALIFQPHSVHHKYIRTIDHRLKCRNAIKVNNSVIKHQPSETAAITQQDAT